jgi:DNA repair protein RadC
MITSLRVVRAGPFPRQFIRSAEDAYRVLGPLARGLDREHFWRLDLDSRKRLLGCELVSVGSLDASIVHPREVFKGALLNNAHSVMVAHNHPSQEARPSKADRQTTLQLLLVGHLLQVELIDHLILTDESYFSFTKARLL